MVDRMDALDVYIAGFKVGELSQLKGGKLSFSYDDRWMSGRIRIPLSLSMPIISKIHTDKVVEAFLWGLLPDNDQTLSKWGQKFQVSPRNPFALLKNVGRDCAGAVQFVPVGEAVTRGQDNQVELLDEAEIGARLKDLRLDGAAARRSGDPGQFSLAGAQAKTAFHYDEVTGRWGIPKGDTPTTHIFKPPMPHLNGHTENEHFCLMLAGMLGMDSAESEILDFNGEKAIVVKRYDRRHVDGRTIRIHQEDMCQALAILPTLKYENQGGPGIVPISTRVLAASLNAAKDRQTFTAANIFNFIIAGTDAHAKNYSMLLGANGEARLAPLYDISSILPHLGQGGINPDMRDVKLAMKIDKTYNVLAIMPRHWERCASAARVSYDFTLETLRSQLAVIPDLAVDCAKAIRGQGIDHEVLDRLVTEIDKRVSGLQRIYGSEASDVLTTDLDAGLVP